MDETVKICVRCVLPETFPGIVYNDEGVCNFCINFSGMAYLERQKDKYRKKFEDLLDRKRKKNGYDCLVCYSGGKDSTYTLDILKNHFGMRVLAFSLDNGFISRVAIENIRVVVEKLGIDHLFFKPRFDLLRRIFFRSAKEVFYSRKSLERASTICTSCINFVKFPALRSAIENDIPFIGYGWSPGQAPVQSSVMKTNPAFVKVTQKAVQEPLIDRFGEEVNVYFLEERHFTRADKFPYNIHPLAFLPYDEKKIYRRLFELGWKKPDDTDPNSTNCLLNSYANWVHISQFGYNPYAFEVASLVRDGTLERDEGIKRLTESVPQDYIDSVEKKLSE